MPDQLSDPRKFPFPPAIPIATLLLAWALEEFFPLRLDWPAWTRWAGWLLITTPFILSFWAAFIFRRHQTAINPLGKSNLIVTSGPFRFSRNPMYVSLILVYLGAALLFQLGWAIPLMPPLFLVFRFAIILPEEKYLTKKFGSQYVEYTHRVRRWF